MPENTSIYASCTKSSCSKLHWHVPTPLCLIPSVSNWFSASSATSTIWNVPRCSFLLLLFNVQVSAAYSATFQTVLFITRFVAHSSISLLTIFYPWTKSYRRNSCLWRSSSHDSVSDFLRHTYTMYYMHRLRGTYGKMKRPDNGVVSHRIDTKFDKTVEFEN